MCPESDRRREMRGRYLVQNPLLAGALAVGDTWGVWSRRASPANGNTDFKRIVVGLNGHVGDGLLALWPLARLRAAFPQAHLGAVGPSWLEPILRPAALLDEYHAVDHWRVSRVAESAFQKWRRFQSQSRLALAQLRVRSYQAALDLYFHFPNHARLLAKAGIPHRIGFSSGGNAPWFTQTAEFTGNMRHAVEHQNELVDQLVLMADRKCPGVIAPSYAVADNLPMILPAPYVVVHPGTGAVQREWPTEHWVTVVRALVWQGKRLVFTGRGDREQAVIRMLSAQAPGSLDLCGRLDWLQLAAVVRGASAVLGVESMIGHLAALFECPTVSIYCGINPLTRWKPVGAKATALQHSVPCSPCHRSGGCAGMECVRGVTPAQVLETLGKLTGGDLAA